MFGAMFIERPKWDSYKFSDVIEDISRLGTKIPKDDYLAEGSYAIVDQSQDYICGYRNEPDGLFENVPVIVFGDHTRCFKYIDFPLFMGADGVKMLQIKRDDVDYRFMIEELRQMPLPNMGYNRHFRWLKEFPIYLPPYELQLKYRAMVEQSDKSKFVR